MDREDLDKSWREHPEATYGDITDYLMKLQMMRYDDLFWCYKISKETEEFTFSKYLKIKYETTK